jgi:hypothetical protein
MLAADDAGDMLAVWTGTDSSRDGFLEASVRAQGGAWSPPVPLASVMGEVSVSPPAVSASGEATVVWVEETRTGKRAVHRIDVRTYRPGSGWGPVTTLAADAGSAQVRGGLPVPQVVLDREGQPLVAFNLKRPDGREYVQLTVRRSDGQWDAPRIVARTARCDELVLRTDERGETLLAWSRHVTDSPEAGWIETLILNARGARESTPFIDSGPEADGLALATDARGDAVITWNRVLPDGEGQGPLLVRPRPAGGAFGRRHRLAPKGYPARVAVASNGESTVLFERTIFTGPVTASEPALEIEAVNHAAHGSWSKPLRLSRGEGMNPSLGSTASGEMLALWETPEPMSHTALAPPDASLRPAGGSWQTPAALPAGTTPIESSTIVLWGGGRATAAWTSSYTHGSASEASIEASDYEPSGTAAP